MSTRYRRGAAWSHRSPPLADRRAAHLLMALRGLIEHLLTAGLRRVALRRPEVFDRLGGFQEALFVVRNRRLTGLDRLAAARPPVAKNEDRQSQG